MTEQTAHNDRIVEVKDLKMYFPVTRGLLRRKVADVKAVDGVSFHIRRGEVLGLVGESGSWPSAGHGPLRLLSIASSTADSCRFRFPRTPRAWEYRTKRSVGSYRDGAAVGAFWQPVR